MALPVEILTRLPRHHARLLAQGEGDEFAAVLQATSDRLNAERLASEERIAAFEPFPEVPLGEFRGLEGSLLAVQRRLDAVGAPPFLLWSGARALAATQDGILDLELNAPRCALLLWKTGSVGPFPEIAPEALPAGVTLQVVALDGAPPSPQVQGSRFAGRVLA